MENPVQYTDLQKSQIEAMLRYLFPGAFTQHVAEFNFFQPEDTGEDDEVDWHVRFTNNCQRSVAEVLGNLIIKKSNYYMNNPREGEISNSNNRKPKEMRVLMEMSGIDNEVQWLYDEMKFIFKAFEITAAKN